MLAPAFELEYARVNQNLFPRAVRDPTSGGRGLPFTVACRSDSGSWQGDGGEASKAWIAFGRRDSRTQSRRAENTFWPLRTASQRTIAINSQEITILHLRPEFESTIRMPEEVTSVFLGSPGEFKAEHNEGKPEYVYVKPITKQAAQSNLLIATKSGQHVTLELVSDGTGVPNQSQPVDFLIEYRSARSSLISSDSGAPATPTVLGEVPAHEINRADGGSGSAHFPVSTRSSSSSRK
jgi:hypothetical protein